jgi:hypothetical protein
MPHQTGADNGDARFAHMTTPRIKRSLTRTLEKEAENYPAV